MYMICKGDDNDNNDDIGAAEWSRIIECFYWCNTDNESDTLSKEGGS